MEKKEVDFASLKYFSICVNLLDKKQHYAYGIGLQLLASWKALLVSASLFDYHKADYFCLRSFHNSIGLC